MYTKGMKWSKSLRGRSFLFFSTISLLLMAAVTGNFFVSKRERLPAAAEDAVALATSPLVGSLRIKQRRTEQIVRDLAAAAAVDRAGAKALFSASMPLEVVSGGLWFEPQESAEAQSDRACFLQRDASGGFRVVEGYARRVAFRNMEFYVIGRHLHEGETFWTKVYTDPVSKVRMVTAVSPIYRRGVFAGVASVDVKLRLGTKAVFDSLLDSESYFAVTDRTGIVIFASKHFKGRQLASHFLPSVPADTALAKRLAEESPEISPDEAVLIASEMAHRSHGHDETVRRTIDIVEDDALLGEAAAVARFYFPHTGWQMIVGIPEHVLIADVENIYKKLLVTTVVFIILFLLAGYWFIHRTFLDPLSSLTRQIENGTPQSEVKVDAGEGSEIALLVRRFNERTAALKAALEHEAQSERLLLQQSKMAAMGEMLDAVAHQWKQPLNALSMYNDLLVSDFESGEVDADYIARFREDIQVQIDHMIDTLATFRAFFRPDAALSDFDLRSVADDVLLLAKDDLLKHAVDVRVETEGEPIVLYGSQNEFKHLLLNFISNAKDAFEDNGIAQRRIVVRLIGKPDTPRMEVCDNAGGIPEAVMQKIFQAHFTTKETGKGTGIGLYMSLQIANKHHAELSVENREGGACFIVRFSEQSLKNQNEKE